jgi:hypothetical protein
MIRLVRALPLAAVLVLVLAQPALAGGDSHLAGGGTATISQVAFNVAVSDSGTASGTFTCLMAGRSAFVLPAFGLAHIMKIQATPTAGSAVGSKVTFSGPARLIMDNGRHLDVHVQVWADAATQQFQLTVVEVGTLDRETMLTGKFSLN